MGSTAVTAGGSVVTSGGTVATAQFQLGKARSSSKPDFDPLVTDAKGVTSAFTTTNTSPKTDAPCAEFDGRSAGPWIMGPVMANCVRRSNALLGYADALDYSDAMLRPASFGERLLKSRTRPSPLDTQRAREARTPV